MQNPILCQINVMLKVSFFFLPWPFFFLAVKNTNANHAPLRHRIFFGIIVCSQHVKLSTARSIYVVFLFLESFI